MGVAWELLEGYEQYEVIIILRINVLKLKDSSLRLESGKTS